jgi:hypothetical protein
VQLHCRFKLHCELHWNLHWDLHRPHPFVVPDQDDASNSALDLVERADRKDQLTSGTYFLTIKP